MDFTVEEMELLQQAMTMLHRSTLRQQTAHPQFKQVTDRIVAEIEQLQHKLRLGPSVKTKK